MSAEVMEELARRWKLDVPHVRQRIGELLVNAGLVEEASDFNGYQPGDEYAKWLVLGVTSDDHIAVLDADDKPILWLS